MSELSIVQHLVLPRATTAYCQLRYSHMLKRPIVQLKVLPHATTDNCST